MQLDPDQREWLYQEQQERLRWKNKLQRHSHKRLKWVPAAVAVLLIALLIGVVSSETFGELIARLRR